MNIRLKKTMCMLYLLLLPVAVYSRKENKESLAENVCETVDSAEGNIPTAASLLKNNYITEGDWARLYAVFAKADSGGKLIIGALGGSITEGAACPDPDKRYISIVLDWWKKTFPKAEFGLVNAGIGATGSNYGSMRVKRDLLSKSPDFIVMDYAVNDRNTKADAESYEGVVRQILNAPQKPALFLLFMMREDGTNAQEWESEVGTHYRLPMISYRDALWPEIQTGNLQWEQISPDQVHPNETGHVLTGKLICVALENAYQKFRRKKAQTDLPDIPEPLLSGMFEFTSVFDGEDLVPLTNKGWIFDSTKQKSVGWKSSVPGSVLEFEIYGRSVYLSCWRINGPMGKAKVSIDGGKSVIIDAWYDRTWGGYRYMLPVGENLPAEKHTVRIELSDEKNEQSTGHEFRILCIGAVGVE